MHIIDSTGCTIWTLVAEGGTATAIAPPDDHSPAAAAVVPPSALSTRSPPLYSPAVGRQYASVMSTGKRGEGRGQMWLPRAMALLGDSLFVADTFNHRVVRFTRRQGSGVLRWRHHCCFGGYGSGRSQLNKPWGVCIMEGRLLIVDRNNHRLVLTTVHGKVNILHACTLYVHGKVDRLVSSK